jgi:hypothetical protein
MTAPKSPRDDDAFDNLEDLIGDEYQEDPADLEDDGSSTDEAGYADTEDDADDAEACDICGASDHSTASCPEDD